MAEKKSKWPNGFLSPRPFSAKEFEAAVEKFVEDESETKKFVREELRAAVFYALDIDEDSLHIVTQARMVT